jgi:uncharacterized damage-inducible protein DinB
MNTQEKTTTAVAVLPMEGVLEHWQGHRRLTRRVIEAFPEEVFETYTIGGMRPFSELAWEMIGMAEPGIKGIVTGVWAQDGELEHHINAGQNKAYTLQRWDEVTELIDRLWPEIPAGRLEQVEAAFGLYNQPIWNTLLYFIDNEIHHRGQGYVYLRSLGIEPPPFWDRR